MAGKPTTLDTIFCAAIELPSAADRAAYLAEACGGDDDLRDRVERLVAAHFQAGDFLEAPASELLATIEDAPAEEPGATIGAYQLLERIGEGGFGIVFMAQQTRPIRRVVALKIVKPGMDTHQVVARFEAERQALAIMDHPNIAKVLDGGATAHGRPYFVMELVRGMPITQFCDLRRLTPRQRLELFLPICRAVHHAHQKGIIHRDLKPSNILVDEHDGAPVVKVIDFGVAKALRGHLTEHSLATGCAQMIGTPLYMSPEQAGQNGLDIDTRSDIYSLGVLLYELLTGTTPFDRERLRSLSPDEIRRILQQEEPARPSTRINALGETATIVCANRQTEARRLGQLIRGELDWVVMKCLEKDRNRRYDTASDLAQDVSRYLSDEPVQACPPSAWYRVRKFIRRNKWALATATVVAGAVLLAVGSLGWLVRDKSLRREQAVQEAKAARIDVDALRREGKWTAALAVTNRVATLLATSGADPGFHRSFTELSRDLRMAADLEEIRLRRSEVKDGSFDWALVESEYSAAFRAYGIDVEAIDFASAEAIAARAICDELAAALDDWACIRQSRNDPGAKKLYALAAKADPASPYRNRLRNALGRPDRQALEELAESQELERLPPSTVILLSQALRTVGAKSKAVAVLETAQRQRPDDLWVNHELAFALHYAKPPRLEEAARFYTAALALRPQSPGMHLNLGNVFYDLNDLTFAADEYLRAIQLKPDYAEAYTNLGRVLAKQGKLPDALTVHRRALELKPELAQAHVNLGYALAKMGKLPEAIDEFHRAIQLRPKDGGAYISLGSALDSAGKYADAREQFLHAIELKPDEPMSYNDLGLTLTRLNKLAEAVDQFRHAIELRPDYAEAHNNLGVALAKMGKFAEAAEHHRQAIHFKAQFAEAHVDLGSTLAQLGKVAEAMDEYRQAIRLKPDMASAHGNFGGMLLQCGKPKEAVVEYRRAIELQPDYADAYSDLALALTHLGQHDEALEQHHRALALQPDVAKNQASFGMSLAQMGRMQEAESPLRRAVQLQPDFVEAHLELGRVLVALGRTPEAATSYRTAIQLSPDYAEAHCNLGNALLRDGCFAEGLASLRRGHELGSKRAQWPYPSARWVREAERLVELDAKLPKALAGESPPADAAERVGLAGLCQNHKQLYAASARFYGEAFSAQPDLAKGVHRYDAACVAALAGCGQGKDASELAESERDRLRTQARAWLRAELDEQRHQFEKDPPKTREAVLGAMMHWQRDSDLAGVRGPEALSKLPEAERREWQQLWAEVETLRKRAGEMQ